MEESIKGSSSPRQFIDHSDPYDFNPLDNNLEIGQYSSVKAKYAMVSNIFEINSWKKYSLCWRKNQLSRLMWVLGKM